MTQYKAFLEAVGTDTLVLPNCDFDTGQPTKAAEYSLTDNAYLLWTGPASTFSPPGVQIQSWCNSV